MHKYLIVEGAFYAIYGHAFGCLILERKNDNASLLLQGDDAHYFWDELSYIDEFYEEDDIGYHVDCLCSDYDEMMCVPAISRASRGHPSWLKQQVA